MNQKEGVYKAITGVIGEIKGAVNLTDTQEQQVYSALMQGFRKGEIAHAALPTDDKELKRYVVGLTNNWVRKDTRLNGGSKYQPKHPGSRAGSGDKSLKAMRELLKMSEDETARTKIQEYINKRIAELKPKKEVDFSSLPPELQKFVVQ